MIDLTIPYSDLPRLFLENETNLNYSLFDILDYPLKYKAFDNLLSGEYITTYPYSIEIALDEFYQLIKFKAKVSIHEAFFLQFSGLVTAYLKTLNIILDHEGAIPLDWRYYIAIMVTNF